MNSHRLAFLARFFILLVASFGSQSFGQGGTAPSNIFTLDTRSGVSVRGVVLNGTTPYGPHQPLAGASVAIGAASATSDSRGAFDLKVPLASQQTADISAAGYAAWSKVIGPQANGTVLDLGTITLRPNTKPVVQSLEMSPDYSFLAEQGIQATLTATVNWLGYTPKRVELREGTRLLASTQASGTTVQFPLDLDALFPGGSIRSYSLSVTAVGTGAGGEVASMPTTRPLNVFPWPAFLQALQAYSVMTGHGVALDFSLNTKEHKVTLPVIGRFGYQFGLGGSFDYTFADASWEAALGVSYSESVGKRGRRPKIPGFARYDRPHFYIGDREIELEIFARAAGNGLPGLGIKVDEIAGGMGVSTRLELARYGVLDLIGPGLTATARKVAGEDFVRNFSVRLDALPEISGEGVFAPRWPLEFKEATLDLGLGLEAVYAPKVGGKSAKVYIGGKATGTFGLPEPIFRQVNFKAYAGVEVDAWVFDIKGQYVFLDYTVPGRRLPAGSYPVPGGILVVAADNDTSWNLRERSWRDAGTERFLPIPEGPGRRLDDQQIEANAALDVFRRMGDSPSPGAVHQPAPSGPGRRLLSDPALPAGAGLPLLGNVFPGSAPSLAARGNELMLLYVRDTGATNPVQYTETVWTRFDGTSWSVPAALGVSPSATSVEGFNAATVPAGWAVDKPGSLDVLFVPASSYPSGFSPSEGSHMVRVNSYSTSSGTVRLRKTEPFSTVNLTGATVSFDWTVDGGYSSSNDRVSVEWSANGTTWNSAGTVSRYASTGSAWTQRSFSLPAAALGLPQVFVSFLFTTEYGNDCHLDNLRIKLDSPTLVDTRGQFRPQVAYAANGDAIAVFERVKDPAYSGNDITTYAGLMEICWSRWNQATKTWSAPVALTDNAILDFEPRIAGPLADGSILALWRESASGELDASPTALQRLMTARWTPGTGTWTAPAALLGPSGGLLAADIAAAADKAVVAWSVDGDGDPATDADSEVFYRVFSAGAWGAAVAMTTDTVPDRNPQVWVDAGGNVSLVWDSNGQLVHSRNFAAAPVVRDTAEGLTVAEYALTGGPGGNLVLIWQEMGAHGSDAHYRVYDPASGSWSLDTRLSADSDVERDFSAVWDAMGNLTIAYNNAAVTLQTVSVVTEGAGTVDVENVPQTGQVDLLLAKRAIVRDLAVVPGSLKVSGLGFSPGEAVTVTCEVTNTGNVAVENTVVAFYDGDPATGGVEVRRETLAGWLASSEVRTVTFPWTIPAPARARVLYSVVDPDKTVTEFSESNNAASLTVGGLDLEVAARETTVLRDGALRVVARIENIGSAPAPVAALTLSREGEPPVSLGEKIVSQLEAGSTVEIVFDLPPGTQPEGEGSYLLTVDGEALSGDPDPLNNMAAFTAVLWIDDDNDGLPRWWEQANGLSDSDPLEGTGDRDRDGFPDAAEYRAGTDPRNANDYLRVGQFHTTAAAPEGGNRQVSFSWASAPGALYDVQRSFTLNGGWETIARDVPATPPLNTYTDPLPANTPKAFYRLQAK